MKEAILAAAIRLLYIVVGDLANEIRAFIQRLRVQRADNEPLDRMVSSMVKEVANRWGDFADWKEALGYASDRVMEWLKEEGRDVERAIVNGRIEIKIAALREKGLIR